MSRWLVVHKSHGCTVSVNETSLSCIAPSTWSQARSHIVTRWNINSNDARSGTITHNIWPPMVHSSDCRCRIFGKVPVPLDGLVMSFNEGLCTLVVGSKAGALVGELSYTPNEDLDPCANRMRNSRLENTVTNSLSSTYILPMIFKHARIKRKSFSVISRFTGEKHLWWILSGFGVLFGSSIPSHMSKNLKAMAVTSKFWEHLMCSLLPLYNFE